MLVEEGIFDENGSVLETLKHQWDVVTIRSDVGRAVVEKHVSIDDR